MICFRDTTFCIAKCANHLCQSKLTEQVQKDAVKWWGSEKAPIAVSDMSSNCGKFIQEVDGGA